LFVATNTYINRKHGQWERDVEGIELWVLPSTTPKRLLLKIVTWLFVATNTYINRKHGQWERDVEGIELWVFQFKSRAFNVEFMVVSYYSPSFPKVIE
jgi:hypothetical protein